MVCMSGGKDSYVLLHLLRAIQARAPFRFELVAVHLDQHQPGFDTGVVRRFLEAQGVEHRIVSEDTYSIVVDKTPAGKAYCSMCSRLRRGILYNTAVELGCTKLALGHHRDDSIETLMLNLLYAGQLKAMPPRLTSDDGRNVVIRPLIHCAEKDVAALAAALGFPVQPCTVCSRQPDLKRARVKALLDQLEGETPNLRANVYAALSNVRPSHLLDPALRAAAGDASPDEDDAAVALGAALESGCGVA
jgi:tRNA 2-thiocytidine biosynthesis protein TtcA